LPEENAMTLSRRFVLAAGAASAASFRPARADALPVVKIGVLTDLSGQYRDNSGPTSVLATKLAVQDFKPENHGFTVEVIAADHQQKPDVGLTVARKWFDTENVDCIVDLNNTAIALAVDGYVAEKDKVSLITGAASADLTGKACSANVIHFAPDTFGDAHSTGSAMLKAGGDTWFLVAADYAFGHNLERDITALVKASGGKVLGSVAYPFPGTTDFSSFLVQAQASGAKVVGLCNTGGDMENCVKQAREFGLAEGGTKVAALFGFITEVKSMGLDVAQGLQISETFYWDLNDRTRGFTKRLLATSNGIYPSSLHASAYAGTTHYLKTVAAMGAAKAKASGRATIAAMRAMPTDDDCFGPATIRADGRFLCPVYLFQVKTPKQSTGPWDVYNLLATTPGAEAFRPLSEHACPLLPA
jgi:branched-chain amino acid transport system substrate-binding protein